MSIKYIEAWQDNASALAIIVDSWRTRHQEVSRKLKALHNNQKIDWIPFPVSGTNTFVRLSHFEGNIRIFLVNDPAERWAGMYYEQPPGLLNSWIITFGSLQNLSRQPTPEKIRRMDPKRTKTHGRVEWDGDSNASKISPENPMTLSEVEKILALFPADLFSSQNR